MEQTFPLIALPLSSTPPPEYVLEGKGTRDSFRKGVNDRDTFLGQTRCVVCGETSDGLLNHCHIYPCGDKEGWTDLKRRAWVPDTAKDDPGKEPRNGLLMCQHHHTLFDTFKFFIRFYPDEKRFIFINYSNTDVLQRFHGRAIALDVKDPLVPYPTLFIIHEMRVRGFTPFAPVIPVVSKPIQWQDWIHSDGVHDSITDTLRADGSSGHGSAQAPSPVT